MDEWRWEEWIPHLEELRVRLIRAIIVYLIVVGVMWFFHKPILDFIARPVGKLYLFNVQDPFFVRLKIAFISALFFVFPYFIWEIWRFVEPALYPHERKAAALVLISAIGILARMGIVRSSFLSGRRREIIVAIVILTAVISPTVDMFSLLLMSLPLILLFEVSIWVARILEPKGEGSGV